MSAVLKPSLAKSVKERVSKEEWELRVDLAAAYQLAVIFKWTDLIYTHFSARLPGHDEFLINPYGLMFEEITASNLIRIDHHGKVLDDPLGLGYNEAGFVIHGCVHEARPDAQCVIHTHARAGVAVSAMKCGLLPISQHAMRIQRQVSYHDYEGIALDLDERTRMAKDLGGTSKAMILRNHGLLTLGASVREAFEVMYYLDCACQIQVDAMAGGIDNVQQMSQQAGDAAAGQFERPDRPSAHKDWPALLRLLERKGSNYAS
ncbi:MAG: class II aldolase/adducin family protein [Betaproteobacteria bacterium]|nr:class II aldolase/adducin family protein [Betaproteobacteria bacterium]MSQ88961.1 class II aldolase/adducin family protein [Betaproteobacteria bacterium]